MMICRIRYFFFKQKTAYEMRISDWSSDGCSSDLASWAIQAELRQHLFGKLGGVAFFGVGGIAEDAGAIWKHSTVLTSGGVGIRYLASKDANVNLRADIAWGKDGAAFYFGIGEAF